MAININTLKEVVDFFLKKNSRGESSASDFNKAVNYESRKAFNECFPNQPHSDKPYQVFRQSRQLQEKLAPFKSSPTALTRTPSGFTLPSGCAHIEAVRYGDVEVKFVNENELGNVLSSKIIAPTEEFPVYVLYNGFFQVYPTADIDQVHLVYYSYPIEAKWAFTLDVNNRKVYDAVNSVNLQWNDNMFNELVMGILSSLGLSLKDTELYQIAEVKGDKTE